MHVRSLLAVALAALLAAPVAASAQAKKGSSTEAAPASKPAAAQTASLGGWIGGEWGDLDGFQLRGDVDVPIQKLTPQVALSLVGALGYSHLDEFGFDVDILKIVPAARFTLPVTPELSLFGDAGLGLYWASADAGNDELSLLLRFAAGGLFAVNPRVKLGVQLVVDPMFGDYDDTTVALLAGLTYRL